MSQDELARKLETHVRNVSRWENEHNVPRADTLLLISAATGRDPGWFWAHEGDK